MAKVNSDEIRLKIGIEADEAQKRIHNLTKANKELAKQNQETRKALTALATAEGDTREAAAK